MRSVFLRDLRLAMRRRADTAAALFFFVIVASLFPLGVGPEPKLLRTMAPGVVWVAALLASMLSLGRLFSDDHQDGTLEQMLLSRHSTIMVAAGKALAHWLLTGLPLILAAPVLGVLFDMRASSILTMEAGLILGTPVLSLLGSIGAALTLGLRSGGVLILLLVLPLCIPVLIFGAGAVGSVDVGLSAAGHLSLLGALLLLALVAAPPAAASALRISMS